MEVESRQIEVLEQFCLLAKSARGRGLVELISTATADPNLFAFGELLDCPQIKDLRGSEHAAAIDLLRLFAYGTWPDFKANEACLPKLLAAQEQKLKQLTVMTMAETEKILPYAVLMERLEIRSVRELEDFLINLCMYSGIVRGKLDQKQRCFEVQYAAGRDLRPGQLEGTIATLAQWLKTSEGLLSTIEERIKWADVEGEAHAKHLKETEEQAEEVKRAIREEAEVRGQQEAMYGEGPSGMDYMEEGDRARPKRSGQRRK